MKHLLTAFALWLGLLAPVLAQSSVNPATQAQIAIVGTVAASTRIITGIASKRIYVTALLMIPVATGVVTFTTGTGTNCGTSTASITGAMTFSAGQIINHGDGTGAIFVLPAGFDLCVTIATAAAPGSLAYAQF